MAYDPEFGEWVREHLQALGSLEIKRMFGAAGLYSGGVMFAVLDDGVIWLKADKTTDEAFREADSHPFTFPGKDGQVMVTNFWALPETALDDPDEAVVWARRSIDLALKKAAGKRPRKPKI